MYKSLLRVWLIALWLPGYGQVASLTGTHQETNLPNQQASISLVEALEQLEAQYQTRFSYDQDLLDNKQVPKLTVSPTQDKLEAVLKNILTPFRLTFERFDKQTFVIYPQAARQPLRKIEKQSLFDARAVPRVAPATVRSVVTTSARPLLEKTVTGQVLDASSSEPLPGVNVMEKGTSNGTQTDIEGKFSLTVANDATLIFSFIGFLTQEIPADNETALTVQMQEDVAELEEVVVVGYGTQRKEEITSAVVQVDAEEFNQGNVNNTQQLLQGKVAGLNIAREGGDPNQPFRIRLRGLSSLGANAEPLVIIDGVIGGSIDAVDPSDIESINVLKDAAAGAIYGTRGSSGVIIITTKSGKGAVAPSLEYRGFVAVESIANSIPVADREQFLENGGLDLGSDTDWLDEVSMNAVTHVHNISFTNATDGGLSYRASVNYRDVAGVVEGTGFEQLNGRINVTQRMLDNRLKLTSIVSVTDRNANVGFAQSLRYALTFNPTAPILEDRTAEQLGRDPNQFGGYFETGVQDVFNPVALNALNSRTEDRRVLLANFKAELEPVDGLLLGANYSTQATNQIQGEFFASTAQFSGAGLNGRARRTTVSETSDLFEVTATYANEIGDLRYEALGGYSYQQFDFQNVFASNTNFITNEIGFDNLGLGLGINNQEAGLGSNREEAKLAAYFGRINLNYRNLAFLSSSVRSEASSRFGANNRRGTFWAVSGGVNIDELVNVPAIDQLKLRMGYGVTGNEPRQRLAFLQRLGAVGRGYVNGEFVTAIGPISNPNPDLKWEEKAEFNVGVDFVLANSRVSGSIDYFTRNTSDLLNVVEVPSPPNIFGTSLLNLGELETTGFEFQADWLVINGTNFQWSLGGNISTFRTTLVNLNDQESFITFEGDLGAPGLAGIEPIIVEEGEQLGQIRAGMFAGYNEFGQTLIINQETGEATTERNLDRDGVIVGNGLPDFTFGINNTFAYKNFDLNFFLRGAVGHSLVNIQRAYWEHPGLGGRQNFVVTDNFNPDDTELDAYHSGYVEKADYIRLDNATLGYTLNLPEGSTIRGLRFFLSGNNIFTVTGYSGSDPEVRYADVGPIQDGDTRATFSPGENILVPGVDRRVTYLPTRSFTLGVNIKL